LKSDVALPLTSSAASTKCSPSRFAADDRNPFNPNYPHFHRPPPNVTTSKLPSPDWSAHALIRALNRLGLVAALAVSGATTGSDTPALPNEGQALAAELRSSPPPADLEVTGLIRVRRDDGRRTTQPFRYRVIRGDNLWRQIYEALPGGLQTPETLVITHRPDAAPLYTLGGRVDATGKPADSVTLTGDRAMIPFARSDFWLADLGLEFLHWPGQRIDHNTRLTMRKGRSCRVLESTNPDPGAAGYTRVRSWIDIKTGGIIIAEAYGSDNRSAKEFEIGGFTKVNQRWELKNLQMRNLRSDTRTILEFHYKDRE
jgi:hypothetical protein